MTRVIDHGAAESEQAWFEIDRFEVLDHGLLFITGHWTGIRGRRFFRPTLTLRSGGDRHRLLAGIEDKPWAAEEGAPWRARFPWDLGHAELTDVELTVAPDIVIPLPSPAGDTPAAGRPAARVDELAKLRREVHELKAQLEHVRRENERLGEELSSAQTAAVDAAGAVARRDSALAKLELLAAEQERAVGAAKEAAGARDHALSERDEALREREAALRERDRAATELATVQRDLRSVLDRSESLAQEARRLEAERDRALEAQRHVHPARPGPERPAPAWESVRRLPATPSANGPARAAPSPPLTDGPPPQPSKVQIPLFVSPARRRRELPMRDAGWLPRLAAITLLIVVLIVLALILGLI